MEKCSKCDQEATYTTENGLCDLHWAEWRCDGTEYESEEDRKADFQETLRLAQAITATELKIDEWEKGDRAQTLFEYLGWTEQELIAFEARLSVPERLYIDGS